MKIYNDIETKLIAEYAPTILEISDESSQHAGHMGSTGEAETHFSIKIVSEKFAGISMVKQHQMIYKTLQTELSGGVHALRLHTSVTR